MTTVFLSGSRKLGRLNDAVRARLRNMIDKDFHIVVGDANGADKAFQGYLASQGYRNVRVFRSGRTCRNNVGGWEVREVAADPKLRGRAFHTVKDREMAAAADYGFVLWDGKSAGSLENMRELSRRGKRAVVYLAPEGRFATVARPADLEALTGADAPSRTAREDSLPGAAGEAPGKAQGQGALNL